jgi:LysR family hydrogen peroxide-inducible transcriptional activator
MTALNLSALTVQQLRYLLAIDRLRNFKDAAQHCHVSQPALSAQVKKAEELLNVCVFDRSRQPIVPTERGARIISQVVRVLEQFDRIGQVASEGETVAGNCRLGVIPTLASTLLPLFLPAFVQRHPHVSLSIVEMKTDQMARAVREGTLDGGFAVTPLGLPGISEHDVFREALYAYLPPGHPLAAGSSIRQADLMGEMIWLLAEGHCFRGQVLALCNADRARGLDRSSRIDVDTGSFEALAGLVDAGMGVTVLPELFVARLPESQRREQVRAFQAPRPARQVGLIYARDQLRGAVLRALAQVAEEIVPTQMRDRGGEVRVLGLDHPQGG